MVALSSFLESNLRVSLWDWVDSHWRSQRSLHFSSSL